MRLGEDERVAIEKGEKDDIDDGQVQSDEDDDRLTECENKRTVKGSAKSSKETNVSDFDFRSIPVIASELPQVRGFPL